MTPARTNRSQKRGTRRLTHDFTSSEMTPCDKARKRKHRAPCLSIPLSHGYCHANWAPSERLLWSRPLRAPVGVPTDALRVHCLLGRGGARLASQPVGRPPPGSGFGERRVSVCVCVCVCVRVRHSRSSHTACETTISRGHCILCLCSHRC